MSAIKNTGRVTIPTDLDVVLQTLEILKRWGADAIRDCDGTDFPAELQNQNAKIYSTYYTTRKDNAWAKATDWYYKLSQDTDYIRRYRITKDMHWKTATKYGDLDITINLSKPKKAPRQLPLQRMPLKPVIQSISYVRKMKAMPVD